MQQTLFQNYPPEERRQLLEDNADEILEMNFTRKFSGTEKNIRRARNSEIDLELEELDEKLKKYKDEIKLKRDPLVEEKKRILAEIKADGEFIKGKVHKMIDRDNREVGFYDEEGNLVEQRKMTKEDRQVSMKFASRTGTDD